ncbi:MAG: CBM20 domain-containing protein, partial [bacterium]
EGAWARRLPDVLTFLWGPALGAPVELVGGPLRWPLSPGEVVPVRVDARWDVPLTLTAPPSEVVVESLTPGVATVDADAVTAVAPGEARLRVAYGGLEGVVVFEVVAAEATVIEVGVPVSTPADAVVYVAGSDPAIGAWDAAGFALTPQGGGRWAGVLPMPLGTRFEFKITRGSWETVEKGAGGEELPNRVAVTAGVPIVVEVVGWRDDFE